MIDWPKLVACRLGPDPLGRLPARIQIPRPPQSVAQFVEVCERPDIPLRKLATIVEVDVELASNVLRLVNSSTLMLQRRISSIQHAIGMIGLRRCKMLVMSAALHASFVTRDQSGSTVDSFLIEAQERAMFAVRVARLLGIDHDHVYVAALLQDILLHHLLDEFYDTYSKFDRTRESIVDFERTEFQWDHAALAGQLLQRWNFAEEVVACVCYQHEHDVILADDELLKSEIAAVAISGLLPSGFPQEPDIISRFVAYQNHIPGFDFLEIAASVDEEIERNESLPVNRVRLADRLERLALVAVQAPNSETNWVEQQLGSYTLEEEIGRGGMGIVYRARHTMLHRPAAVKMMKTSRVSRQLLERFRVEARTTSELSSPHTVQVYDYGMTPEGTLYYVMEYLDGLSLGDLVYQHGPIPEGRAIHILCQVCGSLSESHHKGLIHRDIKPENIVLTTCAGAHDFAKVLDFGLVAVTGERANKDKETGITGTPNYMSPESIHFPDEVDERSDIYALGGVAHFLVSGKVLFGNLPLRKVICAQVETPPPRLRRHLKAKVSREFEEIVLSCLEKDPRNRPQSVVELAECLNRLEASHEWNFSKAAEWWAMHGNARPTRNRTAQPQTPQRHQQSSTSPAISPKQPDVPAGHSMQSTVIIAEELK
ncbi:Serine/threonine-protein kinase PknB [Thalassoglobus neptunius]|uniref:Serine/threonine-protein kinase PknB n=1 Tax=Thalassoglobus neptunius TaxID=1938619 RepID=A0A5C5X5B8_9PLAN|nr:HDOD domain-containing protein [Thalassoglobus neptunius]TWT57415.1 Serine/threonine-protein kinase PknB [Thalassoglobus neptunius]